MNEAKLNSSQLIKKLGLNNKFIRSVKPRSKRIQYRAAFNWLNLAQNSKEMVKNESSDFSQAQMFLEAIYHLCEAQDYIASIQVLESEIEIPLSNVPKMPLHSYLLYNGQGNQLLKTVDTILEGLQDEESSKCFLRMLKAKAAESLGDRSLAVQIYEDICKREPPQSREYIEAFARLAGCQVQMGQYQVGVPNIENALKYIENAGQDTFTELKSDLLEGLAFYTMNTGSFSEAFDLFGEVFRLRQQNGMMTGLIGPLAHQGIVLRKSSVPRQHLLKILLVNTLRLFGLSWLSNALYNRLCQPLNSTIDRNYERAENLLRQAYSLCEEIENENAKAWIAHHLAWVIINRGQATLAEEEALNALKRYEAIEDRRGISDCYEQLGRIYLAKDRLRLHEAEACLNQALNIRQNINNFHGTASSILSLSFLYWHKGNYIKSLQFSIEATHSYYRIGMLNVNRIIGILTLFSVWTVGNRDWTA
ncbi:MAG: tetratricopeptide repeat protein [Microcoleus sp. PH2017_15_JOR_U_A]|uniref:tetratricopeptide repeat protein n=1 Tax=Microcoleus sp. PH2017_15_JOR_U_A TaxID=2798826 RepID=UPI001D6725FC|nr:tetratricopeptide repeat protein [Microcoleus sp. PH2017_15_JOR_U_A]MCC3500396.1 tetratricopeptide repeat protein [Microcoleus sp. PH2017_15_JOR_U_A]